MPDATPALLPPAAGVAVAVGVVVLARAGAQAALRHGRVSAPAARRALQAAASALALTLPWLFDGAGPVVALAAVFTVGLVAARRPAGGHLSLATRLGPPSTGAAAFPASVAALYALTADQPVLYAVPLLLLGLASPAAAFAGQRHGRTPFSTVGGTKSREGSAVFAAVAFVCVHVPLLLFTPVGRAESLGVACVVAGLAAMLEAVSWRGLDVLVVPLGVYAVLLRLLTFPAPVLAGHAAFLVVLAAAAVALRRETTVGGAGVVAAALLAYLIWAVGGTAYLLPPTLVFLLYARAWPVSREADGLPHSPARRPHTAVNVFSVASVGVFWLVASRVLGQDLLVPYALAWAVPFAFLGVDRMRAARPLWPVPAVAWRAAWRSAAVAVGPGGLVWGLRVVAGVPGAPPSPLVQTATFAAVALAATGTAAVVLARYKREIDLDTGEVEGRLVRAAIVAPLSALGLLVI
ncbi:MAG TPA: hypothetical protein VF576_07715 [Rubricoccaceae bacterium]|jgi:phytol kinase